MSADEITINSSGVTLFGFPLGFAPTIQGFELAVESEVVRSYKTTTKWRERKICDRKGLSWLTDLDLGIVLSLDISLSPVRHRQTTEADCAEFFQGKIRIGQCTVQGPFSFEIGEAIRKIAIPCLSLDLIPDEKRIRAVLIGFKNNEKAVSLAAQ